MKLATVNVIEFANDTITVVHAFPDTKEGSIEAETLFSKMATDQQFDPEAIEIGLEDGQIERGLYKLFLVHSNSNAD
jgi:hypothetical protein